MNALGKLRDMFLGGDGPAPAEGAGRLAPAPDAGAVPAPDEATAREALAAAQGVLADLTARRENMVSTIAGLTGERSRLSRLLAAGDLDAEARFAEVEVAIPTAQARLSGLDELLGEAEASRKAAQLQLNEAERPRREAERRARIEASRSVAQAAAERLRTAYREACRASGELAVALDELDGLAPGQAAVVEGYLDGPGLDEFDKLLAAGWVVRPSRWLPARRTIFVLSAPVGK